MATCLKPDRQPSAPPCDVGAAETHVRLAAVAYTMSDNEARLLAQHLGAEWDVVDGRDCDHPDLVLVRPCSPQTVAGLRRRFPDTELVALEPGWPAGPARGPIGRARAAGLDAYALGLADMRVGATDRQHGGVSRPGR